MSTGTATPTTTSKRHAAFWTELEAKIAKYDLLCHPYYQAWSAGELTQRDLREYAADYYHHVAAFPTYLSALHSRLEDGALRRAVLRNLMEEEIEGPAHSDLWMNFAEGMGADREVVRAGRPVKELEELMIRFRNIAASGTFPAAMAAFYVYESQVPRVAKEKARGLKEMYGADSKTCGYFTLHQTADVLHSQVWREQLDLLLDAEPEAGAEALIAAEAAAQALWKALDGIERKRMAAKLN
ncbi:MAG TPA: CADD family putative folate metabolism protein [Terriglobales bacterium]|nr:CADD family putative folate metabolism protein [Terriglobales bacterium]